MVNGSSLLLDLDGVVVESVRRREDGTRLVVVGTAAPWVGVCPECGERSTTSKGWVTTSPRDVQVGPDRPVLQWRKRKWLCPGAVCDRKVFTKTVSGGTARARVTPRAKASMATEVLDRGRSVAAVASDYRCGWHTVHDHVVAVADAVLALNFLHINSTITAELGINCHRAIRVLTTTLPFQMAQTIRSRSPR